MAVRLSALRAGQTPFTPRKIPGIHFYYTLSRPQGHSATRRIRSIEKSNDTIGNRTRDLPACSIVPQPTTLRFKKSYILGNNFYLKKMKQTAVCMIQIHSEFASNVMMLHTCHKLRQLTVNTKSIEMLRAEIAVSCSFWVEPRGLRCSAEGCSEGEGIASFSKTF
jgi:hypothetical protein